MYKEVDKSHFSFLDFNQPLGLHMNPNNRWIKMADAIPWDIFEGITEASVNQKESAFPVPGLGDQVQKQSNQIKRLNIRIIQIE